MIEFFGHPFSSYTWKALIAFYENDIPFDYKILEVEFPDNSARLNGFSPQGKFPAILDGDAALFEASIIIEYLQQKYPSPVRLIPDVINAALDVRMLDRFFDNYVMTPMNHIVADFMRPPERRNAQTVEDAKTMLARSYSWLETRLEGKRFVCGEDFTLADCAAAPSLFYADWVLEIAPELKNLRAYRARLLARPSVKRCVDDARPYRHYFPPGAPDRD